MSLLRLPTWAWLTLTVAFALLPFSVEAQPTRRPLRQELADIKARLEEEKQRAEDRKRTVTELEAEVGRLAESLRAEREAKVKLEEVLSKGKKWVGMPVRRHLTVTATSSGG